VRDGNVDKALRKLKKKVNNSGVLLETRRKQEYEKPTTTRKLAKNAAKKRWQKTLAEISCSTKTSLQRLLTNRQIYCINSIAMPIVGCRYFLL